MYNKNKKGFSLIEILIAITLITMLAAIVIIAVNPTRQFSQGRDTQRWAAVNTILNAVYQNMVDNNGNFYFPGCPATAFSVSAENISSSGAANTIDLCACLVPTYIAGMPYDPITATPPYQYTACTNYNSGYTILQAANGRITVAAPEDELQTISVTR